MHSGFISPINDSGERVIIFLHISLCVWASNMLPNFSWTTELILMKLLLFLLQGSPPVLCILCSHRHPWMHVYNLINFWSLPNSRWLPQLMDLIIQHKKWSIQSFAQILAKIWCGCGWESSSTHTLSTTDLVRFLCTAWGGTYHLQGFIKANIIKKSKLQHDSVADDMHSFKAVNFVCAPDNRLKFSFMRVYSSTINS